MKNIPLISRHITPLCNSFTEALELLETHEIEEGELVYVEYIDDQNTKNIILALGIVDHDYRILNLGASEPVNGVLSYFPGIDSLIHNQKYIVNDSGNSYLVYCKDGKTRTIEEIQPEQTKTFIDLENSSYLFSWLGKVRQLDDIPEQLESNSKIENKLEFQQRDWLEEDKNSTAYIHNKPSLSQLGTITYTIQKEEDNDNIYYNLFWTPYNTENDLLKGTIIAYKNNIPVSGELKRVGENDESDWEVGDYYLDILMSNESHIYIRMQDLKVTYNIGPGIELGEDNRLHLRIDTTTGLTINPEGQLSWNLATEDQGGAISILDHEKINNFYIDNYVKVKDITGGSIIAGISENTDYIVGEDRIASIDSPGFIVRETAGQFLNVPGFSCARLRSVYGNTTPFNPTYFKSIGNNIVDYKDQTKQALGYYIDSGTVSAGSTSILFWAYCPLPGKYVINNGYAFNLYECYLSDEPGNIVNRVHLDIYEDSIDDETYYNYFTINSPGWFISYVWDYSNSALSDICISFASDYAITIPGFLDLDYKESIIELKKPEENTWGAISKDGLTDCWRTFGNVLHFIQYWNQANLDDLVWKYEGGIYTSDSLTNLIRPETTNLIYDDSNINNIVVNNAGYLEVRADSTPTGILYYELNEPIDFNTGVSSLFNYGSYGTEQFIGTSQPSEVSIEYLSNPQYYLEDWVNIKSNKVMISDIVDSLDNLGLNFNKVVQGNAIINYLEEKINSSVRDTAIDLSMQDIFGVPQDSMNTANCYVLKDPGYYKFPLVYGNAIKNGKPNRPAYLGKNEAHTLSCFYDHLGYPIQTPWIESNYKTLGQEYIVKSVTIEPIYTGENYNFTDIILTDDRYVSFYYDGLAGYNNFRVIIKNQNNGIIWSWHLWTVDNLDDLIPVSVNNYISTSTHEEGATYYQMMPINLGYTFNNQTSAVYQWGRKDPFSFDVSSVYGTPDDESSNKNIHYSISHPTTPFTRLYQNCNWFYYDINNRENLPYNMWDASLTTSDSQQEMSIKSVYDPCPPGFKVPVLAAFFGFTDSGVSSILTEDNGNIIGEYDDGFSFKTFLTDETGIFIPYFKDWDGSCEPYNNSLSNYFSSSVCTTLSGDSSYSFQFDSTTQLFANGLTFGGLIRPILDD